MELPVKKILIPILLAALFLSSGCVQRTVTSKPGWTNPSTGKPYRLNNSDERLIEQDRIWIWEKGFFSPED